MQKLLQSEIDKKKKKFVSPFNFDTDRLLAMQVFYILFSLIQIFVFVIAVLLVIKVIGNLKY